MSADKTIKKPALFASARAAIELRRAKHETALADLNAERARYETALADLNADLIALDEAERRAAEIGDRYSRAAPAPPRDKTAPIAPERRPNASRPYTPEEDERIKAAARGKLEQLARDLGRPYEGIQKRRALLSKRFTTLPAEDIAGTDCEARPDRVTLLKFSPVPDHAYDPGLFSTTVLTTSSEGVSVSDRVAPEAASDQLASKKPEIIEPTAAAHDETESTSRVSRVKSSNLPPVQSVKSVTGKLVDSGPDDRREYNYPEAFRSKDSD